MAAVVDRTAAGRAGVARVVAVPGGAAPEASRAARGRAASSAAGAAMVGIGAGASATRILSRT